MAVIKDGGGFYLQPAIKLPLLRFMEMLTLQSQTLFCQGHVNNLHSALWIYWQMDILSNRALQTRKQVLKKATGSCLYGILVAPHLKISFIPEMTLIPSPPIPCPQQLNVCLLTAFDDGCTDLTTFGQFVYKPFQHSRCLCKSEICWNASHPVGSSFFNHIPLCRHCVFVILCNLPYWLSAHTHPFLCLSISDLNLFFPQSDLSPHCG